MGKVLKLLMDKPWHNKGYTLIECVFVLLVLMSLLLLTISNTSNNANQVLLTIKEKIHQAHLNSLVYHEPTELVFEGSMLSIGNKVYDFSPWVCEDLVFHYNAIGNINQANTLRCYYKQKEVRFIFNLGTGRCRLEEE